MSKPRVNKSAVRRIFKNFQDNLHRAFALNRVYGINIVAAGLLLERHRSVEERITMITNAIRRDLA